MGIVSGEIFPSFQRHIKIVEWAMDDAAIYLIEAEIGLLPLKYGPRISGILFPLNSIRGLASQVAQDDNNNNLNIFQVRLFVGLYRNVSVRLFRCDVPEV